jgi:hypothetical protein
MDPVSGDFSFIFQEPEYEDCIIIPIFYEAMAMATTQKVDLGRGADGNTLTNPYWSFFWLEDISLK